MKTCRGCPHIALDRWPNGRAAVRCWCSENGDKLGRVLHVTNENNPHPDSVATPKWCRRGDPASAARR